MTHFEQDEAKSNPFSLIKDGHLWIKTKAGDLLPLKLNRAQEKILEEVIKLWEENKIIRLWILKARQLGISTIIEAIIYSITSQVPNMNSLIVADDQDDSSYIFEMSKLFHEKCPQHLRPDIKRSNEKKLEFEGTHSQILIDTAENKDAGRNFTFRAAHLSNYAFFPYPKELMSGLSNSVPSLPRTIIIKETTSKGFNFAKEEWDRVKSGRTEWKGLFFPWFWDDGYKMDGSNLVIGDVSLGDVAVDEKGLAELMARDNVTDIKDRLAWRRWKIINDLGDDTSAFKKEFPSTDLEAFLSTDERTMITPTMLEDLKGVFLYAEVIKRMVSCDPSEGGDACVILAMENGKILGKRILHEKNTMIIAGEMIAMGVSFSINDYCVDNIGIGKGIEDRLREQGKNVIGVRSSEKAIDEFHYYNKRTEMWAYAADLIINKMVDFIDDLELRTQLAAPRYEVIDSTGKIRLEPKAKTKKALGRSPDDADSYVMNLYAQQFIEDCRETKAVHRYYAPQGYKPTAWRKHAYNR